MPLEKRQRHDDIQESSGSSEKVHAPSILGSNVYLQCPTPSTPIRSSRELADYLNATFGNAPSGSLTPFSSLKIDKSYLTMDALAKKYRPKQSEMAEKSWNERYINQALKEFNKDKAAAYVLVGSRSLFCPKDVDSRLGFHFNFFARLPDSPEELFFAELVPGIKVNVVRVDTPFPHDDAPRYHGVIHPEGVPCSSCPRVAEYFANNKDGCYFI